MLIFHDDEKSPNCLKTRILLYELEQPFETVHHDFTRGDLRRPPFVEKFPNAKVPALEDDGLGIAESGAIALYLAEKHGRLLPTDPAARARAFEVLNYEAALLAPTIGGAGLFGELSKPDAERSPQRIEFLSQEAVRVGGVLGAVLGDRPYFAEEYSIADIQLFPGTYKALKHGIIDSESLRAWSARVAARPAVRRAMVEYPLYRE